MLTKQGKTAISTNTICVVAFGSYYTVPASATFVGRFYANEAGAVLGINGVEISLVAAGDQADVWLDGGDVVSGSEGTLHGVETTWL